MDHLDVAGLAITMSSEDRNIDDKTVESFGAEWEHFSQSALDVSELEHFFEGYFDIFPWHEISGSAEGFDMGCGSGRWARMVAPRVRKLNCIDPSARALNVAKRNLRGINNIAFFNAGVSDTPLKPDSQDFGYSLGVLHHIPDTLAAMQSCVKLLKPGAPLLIYLYYRFDNKPAWYKTIWRISNLVRIIISRSPNHLKSITTNIIAGLVYFPLARIARVGEDFGLRVDNWPLSSYRSASFYTMQTDSRDRFGTPLEQRFTRAEITAMMKLSGLENIAFSEHVPFWCAVGRKIRK